MYAASTPLVAAAEAGRFPGAFVSVREVRNIEELRVVNLASITTVTDPIGIENLPQLLRYQRLLQQLNYELSQPVHPDESTIEYIPTQYLSEAIKAAGYDGLYFKSSMISGGMNLVVFDPEKMQVTERGQVHYIESVNFRIRPL